MRLGLRLTIGLMPILSFAASQVSAEIFEDVMIMTLMPAILKLGISITMGLMIL